MSAPDNQELAENTREEGASLVEYALLVALIAIVCVVALQLLGQAASEKFSGIAETINQAS